MDKEKIPKQSGEISRRERGEISRRDFLIGAGSVVVGGAIGAGITYPLVAGKEGEVTTETVEVTKTVEVPGPTVTTTVAAETVTETKTVGAETVTTTIPGPTKTVTTTLADGVVEPAFEPEEMFFKRSNSDGRNGTIADVKNGKIVRIRPLHWDMNYTKAELNPWSMTARGKTWEVPIKSLMSMYHATYKKRVYSPNRIVYPLKRVDWEPGGDPAKINPQNRGISKFKRISWEKALDIVSSEITRVHAKYGIFSILTRQEGHGETKTVHNRHGCSNLVLNALGGHTQEQRTPDSWEGWYWGAKHFWGDGWRGQCKQVGPLILDISKNTEMLLMWGHDPETQVCCYYGQLPSVLMYWYQELGIKLVYISPDLNFSAACHCGAGNKGKWIPVLPNTDNALSLAIAYTWITEDLYDKEYIATHSVGFDKYEDHVLGRDDGVPKTPAWAAPRCGVTEWTIKALAREWHAKVTTTAHREGGPMRGPYAHEIARHEAYNSGMQGLGKPGRHSYADPFGQPRREVRISTRAAKRSGYISGGWPGAENPLIAQHIARSVVHRAVLEATFEKPFTWYGTTQSGAPVEDQFVQYQYPIPKEEGGAEIHMYMTDAPCDQACWNGGNKFIEMFRSPKIECMVAEHMFLEDDCLFADIVLPANTKFEEEDINNADDNAFSYIMYEGKAINSIGESMSDYEIAVELAKKLGVEEEVTGGKTVKEWIKFGYDHSGAEDLISWEELKEKGYYCVQNAPDWEQDPAGLIEFYNDPESDPIGLPSGKLEYYSERLAEHFPDDKERNPVAKWVIGGPPPEWYHDESLEGTRAEKYPLVCQSNHPRWRFHAQFDDVPWFREIETGRIKGYDGYMYESIWLHPETAAARGIEYGDIVKMYNERGIVLGGAYVTERVRPGVARQDHGARTDLITTEIDRGGNNNLICPVNPLSKKATGLCSSGFLVEVEKLDPREMEEWRKTYPEAFARDYDPAYGPLFSGWVEGGI